MYEQQNEQLLPILLFNTCQPPLPEFILALPALRPQVLARQWERRIRRTFTQTLLCSACEPLPLPAQVH